MHIQSVENTTSSEYHEYSRDPFTNSEYLYSRVSVAVLFARMRIAVSVVPPNIRSSLDELGRHLGHWKTLKIWLSDWVLDFNHKYTRSLLLLLQILCLRHNLVNMKVPLYFLCLWAALRLTLSRAKKVHCVRLDNSLQQ